MGKLVVGELGRILWREQRESWWGILEDIEVIGSVCMGPLEANPRQIFSTSNINDIALEVTFLFCVMDEFLALI